VKAVHSQKPTIFIYDRYPGGIGLSEKVYGSWGTVLEQAKSMIEKCPCEKGCPSCTGTLEEGNNSKSLSLKLIAQIKGVQDHVDSK
jgi:DEAD/DEAH box helicase domain-containing protein